MADKENTLYMYFIKDGDRYEKSVPLEDDLKTNLKVARSMAENGMLTWDKHFGKDQYGKIQRKYGTT